MSQDRTAMAEIASNFFQMCSGAHAGFVCTCSHTDQAPCSVCGRGFHGDECVERGRSYIIWRISIRIVIAFVN
ncbi:hypothetical protein C8Q77DRAFT_315800 [Trametes polyzona]|nr:hypothetical protein C8Q77DRAFT_315800 [Trametes polyzona]